jgi:hypothetical protein
MIRLLTSIAGTPMYHAGDIVAVSPAIESAWVAAGIAERVGDQVEQAVTVGATETAMRRRKGRGRA